MEEVFDIYNRDGKHLGRKEKSICHSSNPGFYHKPVWIWIINSNNEILVQKRAKCKKNFPGLWDMPSAGHVVAGETSIEGAIRETYEELGIETKKEDYVFVKEYIYDQFFEIAQIYLLRLDLKVSDFKIQSEEVEQVKWVTLNDFEKLFYSKEFVPFNDDYRTLVVNLFRKEFKKYNMILTSSGYNDVNNYVSEDIISLFKSISKNKNIMIISNAAPKGTGNYIARENVKNNFLNIGASKVDIVDINESNIHSILDYDIVYGLGGNPTYLIELNNKLPLRKYLIEFLKRGIYIGESAGTIILCDDLKWVYTIKKGTKPKYDVELDTYKGLNLTNNKVLPHSNKISEIVKQKAITYENENNIKIIKLEDGEYILEYYEQMPL